MFEKYDGVRGFWNPLKRAFYSRQGNRFTFPQEILDAMPVDLFLDGELWCVFVFLVIYLILEFYPFYSYVLYCALTGSEETTFKSP